MGKKYPQVPPLHLHFDQTESFKVLQGAFGFTVGYDRKDIILTPESGTLHVPPMMPHYPWPVPGQTGRGEDTIMLVIVHPKAVQDELGAAFFIELFAHLDDAYEKKEMPDILLLMHAQHQTASSNVILPSLWILGPLRWWLPWKLQAGVHALVGWLGYKTLGAEAKRDL
jgi:hypothetical protein